MTLKMTKHRSSLFIQVAVVVLFVFSVSCIVYKVLHPTFSTIVHERTRHERNVENENEATKKKERQTEDFIKYWKLERQMRFDFQRILAPCKESLKWKSYYSERTPYMITSANYSGVQLDIRPAGQYSHLLIQSYNIMNTRKTVGGDSWRVLVNGDKSVPVTSIDNMDGTYEMFFLFREAGYYKIDLYLEYTLCDGYKDPPSRWFNLGDEQGKNQPDNALPGYEKAYLEEQYATEKLAFYVQDVGYSIFEDLRVKLSQLEHPPCLMWDGFGEWNIEKTWFPAIEDPYKRKSEKRTENEKGIFWIYGDSVGRRFYNDIVNSSSLCGKVFSKCEHTVNKIYNVQPGTTPRDRKDLDVGRIEHELENVLQNPQILNDQNSAIVINYGLHFLMDTSFSMFTDTIETIVRTIEKYTDKFKGTVIWKTTNTMDKWKYGWPDPNKKHEKTQRFLTEPRVELFNAYSTWRFCQANINVLDIFPLTYSYPFGTGTSERPYNDSVHFVRETFKPVEDYFINYFTYSPVEL